MNEKHFEGKSLTVIGDLSIDEQMHLYKKTAELKHAVQN
jgi:aspartate carbamoyltransferase catalytic subunit